MHLLMRLGELLVDAGLVTETEVLDALQAQQARGGRLGTVVSELGLVDLDTLSRCLGCLHDMPAALARHFAHADRQLQERFPRELADRYECLPLVRAGKHVVMAASTPLEPASRVAIARELGIAPERVVQAIAAEVRIRDELQRVYGIEREPRTTRAAWPLGSAAAIDVVELDAEDVVEEMIAAQPRRETLDTALHRLRRAIDRDDTATLAIDTIATFIPGCRGAAFLSIENSVARSLAGYRIGEDSLDPIAVPVGDSALLHVLVRRRQIVHAASGDLVDADYALLQQLGTDGDQLVLVPVIVGDTVGGALALAVVSGMRDAELTQIGQAASVALTRMALEVEMLQHAHEHADA